MSKTETKLTVQGRDSPGPVDVGGAVTGPPRPSSSDCQSPAVDQAGASVRATGWDQEIDPFQRRDSIKRSPPLSRQSSSTSQDCIFDVFNTISDDIFSANDRDATCATHSTQEVSNTKKRKAGSPLESQKIKENPVVLDEAKRLAQKLTTFVKDKQNVHKAIKMWTQELNNLVQQIALREYKQEQETNQTITRISNELKESKLELAKYKEQQETRLKSLKKEMDKKIKDIQKTHTCQLCGQRDIEDTKLQQEPFKLEYPVDTYDIFEEIERKKWDPQNYSNTKITHGDFLQCTDDNIIFHCDVKAERRSRKEKALLKRYPEALLGVQTVCGDSSFVEIDQLTSYKTEGVLKTKKKKIFMVFYDPTKHNNHETLFNVMKKLQPLWLSNNTNELTITQPASMQNIKFRKMVEAIFHNTSIQISILPSRGHIEENTNLRNSKHKNDAILIYRGEHTYADTLKKLKNGLGGKEVVEHIQNIRKTRKGELLVKLNSRNTTNIASEIKTIMVNHRIDTKTEKPKILHIRDLDETATEKEIQDGIINTNKIKKPDNMIIRSIRPTTTGSQIATVAMDKEDALEILKLQKIRIGLNMCRVEERVNVIKCFRCWDFGHIAKDCTGTDRSMLCQKCGSDGHKKDSCNKEALCLLCEDKHESGSGKCKKYRKALYDRKIAVYRSLELSNIINENPTNQY